VSDVSLKTPGDATANTEICFIRLRSPQFLLFRPAADSIKGGRQNVGNEDEVATVVRLSAFQDGAFLVLRLVRDPDDGRRLHLGRLGHGPDRE
jgi:hypothetical protein